MIRWCLKVTGISSFVIFNGYGLTSAAFGHMYLLYDFYYAIAFARNDHLCNISEIQLFHIVYLYWSCNHKFSTEEFKFSSVSNTIGYTPYCIFYSTIFYSLCSTSYFNYNRIINNQTENETIKLGNMPWCDWLLWTPENILVTMEWEKRENQLLCHEFFK